MVRLKRCFLVGAFVAFAGLVLTAVLFMGEERRRGNKAAPHPISSHENGPDIANVISDELNKSLRNGLALEEETRLKKAKDGVLRPPPAPDTSKAILTTLPTTTTPSTAKTTAKHPPDGNNSDKPDDEVHIFYYPWFGNPEYDNGSYYHWSHQYLLHWNKAEARKWPTGSHEPPGDIGSNFYPQLGPYSNRDLAVVDQHMRWIRTAGVGVVAVSWYPPGMADDQGHAWDDVIPSILDSAKAANLKVTFHIEPYKERNVTNLRENVEYLIETYGKHPAFYYYQHMGKRKPFLYIYDSYLIEDTEWRTLLHSSTPTSLRGTKADAFFIGLLVKDEDKTKLLKSGFDGVYTYFASDGFTYGSTLRNWAKIRAFSKKNKLIFVPSVGPGYMDTRVRPWNGVNIKQRDNGTYYNQSFEAAINSRADLISITSFNEWHEGTQIEPAVAKSLPDGFHYQDYSPMPPDFYLTLTKNAVIRFEKSQTDALVVAQQQNVAAAIVQ